MCFFKFSLRLYGCTNHSNVRTSFGNRYDRDHRVFLSSFHLHLLLRLIMFLKPLYLPLIFNMSVGLLAFSLLPPLFFIRLSFAIDRYDATWALQYGNCAVYLASQELHITRTYHERCTYFEDLRLSMFPDWRHAVMPNNVAEIEIKQMK